MMVFCTACRRKVAYVSRPEKCSYCDNVLPKDVVAEEYPADPRKPYVLTVQDCRFLKSLRILAES